MSSTSQPSLFGKSWFRAHKGYLVALKVAVTAAACAFLAACSYTPDSQAFHQEVSQLVTVGMPTATAISRLNAAGFDCIAHDQVSCTRRREVFLGGCNENVFFDTDKKTATVSRFTAVFIACASL